MVYNADVAQDFTDNFTDRQRTILSLIKKDKYVSTRIMAEVCGVSKRTILMDINSLRDKYIRRVGDSKSGYWEILLLS